MNLKHFLSHIDNTRKLCITNKYKYKIHDKIYPIQHSTRSDTCNLVGKGTTRYTEETNGDEYNYT